jgi:hypothetical protein
MVRALTTSTACQVHLPLLQIWVPNQRLRWKTQKEGNADAHQQCFDNFAVIYPEKTNLARHRILSIGVPRDSQCTKML